LSRLLYLVVSVSGACVLALEIIGTRVLGPFYGVSIYLWSALISITLAALSLGYLIGGRYADRSAGWRPLGFMLGAAGIWVLLIPLMRSGVINLASGMGLRAAVLVAATVLFAPPLTALGMVSPSAIRIKAASLGEVGQTAGDLYAISTIASVVAAIATGFWLVPELGVNGLLATIGGLLLLTAALCFVLDRKIAPAAIAVTLGLSGERLRQPPGRRPRRRTLPAHRRWNSHDHGIWRGRVAASVCSCDGISAAALRGTSKGPASRVGRWNPREEFP
jgi:MFS family permease